MIGNMNRPLVSVHMITYNHEPYIARAIEGVLSQETSFPIELVVGEDCSTDRTREIALDYQQRYPDIIRVITSDENVGMCANANRVSKDCGGKYLAFCEGDDYWHHPKKLQMQVDYLESHPECGLVHGDVDWHDIEADKRIPSFHEEKRLQYQHKNMLNSMIVSEYVVETCTAVVRTEMYNEIRGACAYEFSGEFLMGDVQTWMEIAYRSRVKYIDESFATHNLLPDSASRPKDIEKRTRFVRSSRHIRLHYADKYGGENAVELKRCILGRFDKLLIRAACRAHMPDVAKEILEDSRKYDVPLGPVGHLYFFASEKNTVSWLVRAGILLPWRCWRLLARVGWLRALRNWLRK